jgi:hypothetical protein
MSFEIAYGGFWGQSRLPRQSSHLCEAMPDAKSEEEREMASLLSNAVHG